MDSGNSSISATSEEGKSPEFLEGAIAEHSVICDNCELLDGVLVEPCERLRDLREQLNRKLWKAQQDPYRGRASETRGGGSRGRGN